MRQVFGYRHFNAILFSSRSHCTQTGSHLSTEQMCHLAMALRRWRTHFDVTFCAPIAGKMLHPLSCCCRTANRPCCSARRQTKTCNCRNASGSGCGLKLQTWRGAAQYRSRPYASNRLLAFDPLAIRTRTRCRPKIRRTLRDGFEFNHGVQTLAFRPVRISTWA